MQLSEKELLMVGECLMGHFSTIEKFRSFSQACTDPEIKQLLDSQCSKMEQHSQELMSMVQDSGFSSGMSQYSQPQQYGSSFGTQQSIGSQSQYGTQQSAGSQSQYAAQPSVGTQSQYGTQQSIGSQSQYGTQPSAGSQSQYVAQPSAGTQSQYGTQQGIGSQSQYQQKY